MGKTLSEIDLGAKETQPNSTSSSSEYWKSVEGDRYTWKGSFIQRCAQFFDFDGPIDFWNHWSCSQTQYPRWIDYQCRSNAIQVRSYGQCYNGQERWKAHLAELRINELLKLLNVKHWMGRFFRFNRFKLGIQNDPCQVLNFLTDFVYLTIQNTGAMRAKHLN